MNLWNKIVIATKFVFGGFESATDYLLKILNDFLSKGNIAEGVQKAREFVQSILQYMKKYEKYCPAIWVTHYEKLMAAVQTLVDVFEDGKVTSEEIENAVKAVKAAIEDWMK